MRRDAATPENSTLTPGELGYLDSMARLFRLAMERRERLVLVFDDDAVPHRYFGAKLRELLQVGPVYTT